MANSDGSIIIDVLLDGEQAISSTGKIEKAFAGLGKAVVAAAAIAASAVAAIATEAFKTAVQIDNANAKIQAALGTTAAETKVLGEAAQNVWKRGFGESLDEVTDALVRVKQNIKGIDDGEIEGITKGALALAKTFDADVNEITRGARGLMTGFGIDAQTAFDLMARGAQEGLNFSNDLFDQMAEYGPLWGGMGFSVDEMFGKLVTGAQDGAYNLDYLNDIMKEYEVKTSMMDKSTVDAFKSMSKEAQKTYDSFLKGEITLADLNKVVTKELSGMDDQTAAFRLGVDILGTKFEDLGQETAMAFLTSQNSMDDFAGSMDGIIKAQEETFGQRWDSLTRSASAALVPLGDVLLTFAESLFPAAMSAVEGMTKVFEAIAPIVQTSIDTVIQYVRTAVDFIRNIWAENGDAITQNVSAAFESIQNIIKSVLDTVVPFVQEQLAKVVSFWDANGTQILSAAKTAFEGIKAVIDFVMPAIQFVVDYVWNAIKNVVTGALDLIMGSVKLFSSILTGDFSGMWEGIKQVFSGAIDLILGVMSLTFIGGIRTALVNLSKTAINLIRTKWTSIVNLFKTQSANALSTVTNMVKGVLNFFKNLATNAGSTVRGMSTTVVNYVKTMGTNMLNAIKAVPTKFVQVGKDIINGLVNGIKEMASQAVAAVTNVVDGLVNTATSLLGIHSPSRVFKEIGLWTGEGLIVGLDSSSKNVNKAMSSMVDGILDVSKGYQKEYQKLLDDNTKANTQKIKDNNEKIAKIEATAAKKKRKLTQDEVNQIAKLKRDAKNAELKAEGDANKKYLAMVEQSEKAYLDVVKSYVEDKKSLDELSLVEEAAIWEQAVEMFVVGSAQRIAVQKEYQKAVESINKEILSINESYQKQMQDIDAAYVSEAEKINKEFDDIFNNRMSTLYNFAGTFDEFKVVFDRTGKELTENLQNQVDAFKLWRSEFAGLSKRGIDEDLLSELSDLGVKSLPVLSALNKMTDEELTKYSDLYREKASLAREQTSEELKGLLQENEGKLMDLRAQSDKQLTALQTEWDAKIKGLVTNTSSSLTSLKQVGVDAGQGLLDGLSAMQSPLMNKAKQIAEGIKETIQKALDIHSPSRWMRDFVAGNLAKGFDVGVDKNEGLLKRAAGDLTDAIKAPIVNPLRNASLGIDLKTTPAINNYSSVNNYNDGSNSDAEIFIAPAPIYLEGKKIADVTFERVSQNEYRKAAISAYTQGVSL